MAISVRSWRGKGRDRPPRGDDARMTLSEHLRELRNRVFICVLAIFAGTIAAWVFYGHISDLLLDPIINVGRQLAESKGVHAKPVVSGVSSAFILKTKVSLVAGLVATSPIWLYELWAFIVPGLHRNERRWTLVFVSAAGPLFMAGVVLGYIVLPKGLHVLIGLTPSQVTNLIDLNEYLSFVLRVLLVFGIAFEIPVFVVLLNLAGVLRARHLKRWRAWIIFLIFVFAAVATPSTDPITMLLLALPMTVLFLISEMIARVIDRRRGRDRDPDYTAYDDDETSPL